MGWLDCAQQQSLHRHTAPQLLATEIVGHLFSSSYIKNLLARVSTLRNPPKKKKKKTGIGRNGTA